MASHARTTLNDLQIAKHDQHHLAFAPALDSGVLATTAAGVFMDQMGSRFINIIAIASRSSLIVVIIVITAHFLSPSLS